MRFRLGTVCAFDIKNKRNKYTQTQTLNLVCGSCKELLIGWVLSAGMEAYFLFDLFSTDRMTQIFSLFSLFYSSIMIEQNWEKLLKNQFCWKLILKYLYVLIFVLHRSPLSKNQSCNYISFSIINVAVWLPTVIVLAGKMEPPMYKNLLATQA